MLKQKNNIVAVVDLGGSKVVCLIARTGPQGKLEVLGIGHHVSQGIRGGMITDVKSTEQSIIGAIEAAEKASGEKVRKIYLGISSSNLISHRLTSEITVIGHEINDKDEKKLLIQALDRYNDQDIEVVHSFPYEYILDGNRGIESPLGMYGSKLSVELHVISSQSSMLINIANCAARCQLEIEGYISSAYASGLACLTKDEMELGVTLIEFGGSSTSVSVFDRGKMIFTDGVPLGGINVTNDIARGLCTDFASAERVKVLHGTLVLSSSDAREIIEVPLSTDEDSETNSVMKEVLVEIIRARVEEILEIIQQKMEESGMDRVGGNKIVITGGAAQLSGMRELVNHLFSKTVRTGNIKAMDGLNSKGNSVSYSTSVGMLIYVAGNERANDPFGISTNKEEGMFSRLMQWFKQNLS